MSEVISRQGKADIITSSEPWSGKSHLWPRSFLSRRAPRLSGRPCKPSGNLDRRRLTLYSLRSTFLHVQPPKSLSTHFKTLPGAQSNLSPLPNRRSQSQSLSLAHSTNTHTLPHDQNGGNRFRRPNSSHRPVRASPARHHPHLSKRRHDRRHQRQRQVRRLREDRDGLRRPDQLQRQAPTAAHLDAVVHQAAEWQARLERAAEGGHQLRQCGGVLGDLRMSCPFLPLILGKSVYANVK